MEKIYGAEKGAEYAAKIKEYTIALYKKCAEYALSKGIIIADTKFEFGLDENGNVVPGQLQILAARRIRSRKITAILRQTVCKRLVKSKSGQ